MPHDWPKSLEPLVAVSAPPPGIYTALGPRLLAPWFLRALCPALAGGTRIFWIDAGNAFDAHGLSRTAKAAGQDARVILDRIRLARPFNVYQLEAMLRTKLPAAWKGEPVVLSDPLSPFYDEDLPEEDFMKLTREVLTALAKLPAVWLVLAVERQAPRGRERVLQALLGASTRKAMLTGQEGLTLQALR